MITLALETIFSEGSLCVADGSRILAERSWSRGKSHSESLGVSLESALAAAGVESGDVHQIIVDVGPGSFTGIRIGLNCARALAFATGAKIVCSHSLELLAWRTLSTLQASHTPRRPAGSIVSAINAFQGKVFVGIYGMSPEGRFLTQMQPAVIKPDQLGSVVDKVLGVNRFTPAGDGWALYQKEIGILPTSNTPDVATVSVSAADLISWGFLSENAPQPLVWKEAMPLYLRASGAEEKRDAR
jgi:tRNA threonylcarbamoyl adenosine modification protein YeaZ